MIQNDISNSSFITPDEKEINLRFTELEIIHQGAFNVIVKAKRQGRWWVLKGLSEPYRKDRIYLTLLQKEFEILASMQHPGIVMGIGLEAVDEMGTCIVMEWIDGITLKQWLSLSPTRKERFRVVAQLMDALEYVHGKQAAHRDLKPSNILITRNGQHVKLIDFGLSDTDDYAIYKQPAGSEGYISPEQQTARLTDIRNDIYSLGCVLADMNLGIAYRHIVRKCRAKSESRYQNIAEVRRAFAFIPRLRQGILVLLLLIATALGLHNVRTLQNNLNVANEKLETIADRERLIQEAIEEGKRQMDAVMAEVDMSRFTKDEASTALYVEITQHLGAIWEDYPKSLQPRLTNTEAESVKQVLATYYSDLVKPMLRKLEVNR